MVYLTLSCSATSDLVGCIWQTATFYTQTDKKTERFQAKLSEGKCNFTSLVLAIFFMPVELNSKLQGN